MKSNHEESQGELDARRRGHGNIEERGPSDVTSGVLRVVVPYTTPELTRAALRHAGVCTDLDVHVRLVDIQIVPFPCPPNRPPINRQFSEERLRGFLEESKLPGDVAVLYTRGWLEGFRKVLEPGSLVILVAKKRWWPTREEKLARVLMDAGYDVMLLPVYEVSYVGRFLYRCRSRFLLPRVGLHQSGRTPIRRFQWNMQLRESRRCFFSYI